MCFIETAWVLLKFCEEEPIDNPNHETIIFISVL